MVVHNTVEALSLISTAKTKIASLNYQIGKENHIIGQALLMFKLLDSWKATKLGSTW